MFPVGFVTDHRIEGDKHFVHQGDGDDLGLCPAAIRRSIWRPRQRTTGPSPRPFPETICEGYEHSLRAFVCCVSASEEAARDPPVHGNLRRSEGAGDRRQFRDRRGGGDRARPRPAPTSSSTMSPARTAPKRSPRRSAGRGFGPCAQGRCLEGRPGRGDVPPTPSPSSARSTFWSTMPGCSATRRSTT